MKILGGNQVVFYTSKKGNIEVQLSECIGQLEEYMNEFQIYPGSFIRHNIYANIKDKTSYDKIAPKLEFIAKRRFPLPLIINVIAHVPAEGDVCLESTYIKSNDWNCLFKETKYGSCQHLKKNNLELVIGSVHINKSELQYNTEKAFEKIEELLSMCNLEIGDIVRQWNYIERMLDDESAIQRYQIFNDVRTKYYDKDFDGTGFPASTEVGMYTGGILIEFLAVKNKKDHSQLVQNPIQKAPYEYSPEVLFNKGVYLSSEPTTPKLERARSLNMDTKKMVFVSGTSAIIGEKLKSKGDVKEQTIVILENFKKLKSNENLSNAGLDVSKEGEYSLIKAYIQNKEDFQIVYDILEPKFKNTPFLLVQTELPRKHILVEIEAEVIF